MRSAPEDQREPAGAAAGEKDVAIAGGATAVQRYLAAGLLDELYLQIVPIVLGAGERLLENIGVQSRRHACLEGRPEAQARR